jgi:hypothetical protein
MLALAATTLRADIITTWADHSVAIYPEYSLDLSATTDYVLDLNADGTDDIIFKASPLGTGYVLSETTKVLGYNYGRSGTLFADLRLNSGTSIGTDGQVWGSGGYHMLTHMLVSHGSTLALPSGVFPHDPMSLTDPEGTFEYGGQQFYIGLELSVGGDSHYAWLDIWTPDSPAAYATVNGWAYESNPGVPIVAGAVPEPSSLLLIGSGILAILLARSKTGVR